MEPSFNSIPFLGQAFHLDMQALEARLQQGAFPAGAKFQQIYDAVIRKGYAVVTGLGEIAGVPEHLLLLAPDPKNPAHLRTMREYFLECANEVGLSFKAGDAYIKRS